MVGYKGRQGQVSTDEVQSSVHGEEEWCEMWDTHEASRQMSTEWCTRRFPERECNPPEQYVRTAPDNIQTFMPYLKLTSGLDERNEWKRVAKEQLQSLPRNDILDVVAKLEGKHDIPCKWVLVEKRDGDGEVRRYKARNVVCGNKN